jgi:uncharacterized surface protein with fasciclin (FAS1) repeats
MKTILETLTTDGKFSTLLSTLELAGLAGKINATEQITLFAPDDRAFEKVNLDYLCGDKATLVSVLTYHMLAGKVTADEIGKSHSLYTDCGKSLTIHKNEGKPVIDNGNLVKTDIQCSNGIIHVIDNVFLPEFSGWYCGGC